MKSLVVFESMYGNTHRAAAAIAEGLETAGTVQFGSVAEIDPEAVGEVDLVVIGGPTHVHGMSKPSTRKAAVETAAADDDIEAEPDAAGPGVREWIAKLPDSASKVGAAFDTRIDKPVLLTGSAAKGIAKRMKKHQVALLAEPESFFVLGSEGPLEPGETERARAWGAELAQRCAAGDR